MRLLLLAGTGEARQVAAGLADVPGLRVTASLAGATRTPAPIRAETRQGGWGGAAGQEAWMRAEGIGAVLDATHPCAARIPLRSAAIAGRLGLPYLRLLRPGWRAGPGDDWRRVPDAQAAVAALPAGARVFLATGRQGLADFAGLEGAVVFARVLDRPDGAFPFAAGAFVEGRPPFDLAGEIALLRRLEIGWLVTKDAGGDATRAKLDAARALGIPVILIDRPAAPRAPTVATVDEAVGWARALCG